MLARMLVPKGRIMRSQIDWRGERVPTRMLGPEGVDCKIPYRLERRTKHSL